MNNSDSTVRRVAAILATCSEQPCSTSFALRLRPGSEPDFIVQDHGSIWTFYPRSTAAQDWWAEHVEDGPRLGRNQCVEHRYAQDILDGLLIDGFTAENGRAQ